MMSTLIIAVGDKATLLLYWLSNGLKVLQSKTALYVFESGYLLHLTMQYKDPALLPRLLWQCGCYGVQVDQWLIELRYIGQMFC